MLTAGDEVGRYRVDRLLGAGTFASVYLVRHEVLRSRHALKLLAERWVDDRRVRDRFLAEGRILAQLRHPNLVPVTDVLVEGDRVGLVMEYIDGPSLGAILARQHRLPRREALQLTRDLAAGLHHIHEAGIVHRDLKPDNILVVMDAEGWRPVIVDFGIAKVLQDAMVDAGREDATRAQMRLGTPQYMSPEQIEATHAVDRRADVFALGAMLYEMISGERAFTGETVTEVMYHVTRGAYRRLEGLDPAIQAVIDTALALHPDDRYPTALAMLQALRALPDQGPELAPLTPLPTMAPVGPPTGATLAPRSEPQTDPPLHAKVSAWPLFALMGGLLASVGGAAVVALLLLGERPDDPPAPDTPDTPPTAQRQELPDAAPPVEPPPVPADAPDAADVEVPAVEAPPASPEEVPVLQGDAEPQPAPVAQPPASVPPARPAPPPPRPVPPSDEILLRRGWERQSKGLMACGKGLSAPATWKVSLLVGTDGRVDQADARATTSDDAVAACLVRAAKALRFDPLASPTRQTFNIRLGGA